jgi:hypothetical protein
VPLARVAEAAIDQGQHTEGNEGQAEPFVHGQSLRERR